MPSTMGRPKADDPKVTIPARIPASLLTELQAAADRDQMPLSEWLTVVLARHASTTYLVPATQERPAPRAYAPQTTTGRARQRPDLRPFSKSDQTRRH